MSKISNLIFNNAKHKLTSSFGERSAISTSAGTTSSFHSGTDYGTYNKKLPQYAIEDGYVFAAAKASDGALYVWVIYPRIKKAFLHYHLDSYSVKAGQAVKKGTLLGKTGKTGKATGIHLHLGIRDLSKLTTTQVNKITWNLLRSCSYIDPEKVAYTEPAASTFANFTGYVTASTLNVRSGAGTSYSILGTLSKGKAITVTGQNGDWYKINFNGKTAYVSKTYVSKTKPSTVVYLPKYTGKSTALVDALKAVKVDSSFTYRAKIASANGIKLYAGTPSQNTKLLNLLKAGKAIKP